MTGVKQRLSYELAENAVMQRNKCANIIVHVVCLNRCFYLTHHSTRIEPGQAFKEIRLNQTSYN